MDAPYGISFGPPVGTARSRPVAAGDICRKANSIHARCGRLLWAYYNQPQITKGTTSNLFSPEDPCTRGQVVAYLYRAVGEPEIEDTNNPFVDVEKNKYYYNAVLWAAETDWIDLAADGDEFLPNEYAKKISAAKTSGGYTFAFQN